MIPFSDCDIWAQRAWGFIYCKCTCKSYWTWHHFRAFPLIPRTFVDHSTTAGIGSDACRFHIKYTTNPGLSIRFHVSQLYYSLVLSLLKAQKLNWYTTVSLIITKHGINKGMYFKHYTIFIIKSTIRRNGMKQRPLVNLQQAGNRSQTQKI